jgi:hypothetical protein
VITLLALGLLTVLVLTACASQPPYACPLHATDGCHSMAEIYEASRKASSTAQGEHIMSARSSVAAAPSNPIVHNPGAYREPDVGQPVFRQPQVHRVWIAPYVDADGNLRSGEYTYFATPGEWTYGTLHEPGVASGSTLFAPQRPDHLGFTAVEPSKASTVPPVPPGKAVESLPTPTGVSPAAAAAAREGITQPAETLTHPN